VLNEHKEVKIQIHSKVDNRDPGIDLRPFRLTSVGKDTGEPQKVELCAGVDEDVPEGEQAAVELVDRVGAGHGDDGCERGARLAAPCGALPSEPAQLVVCGPGARRAVDLALVHERRLVNELLVVRDEVVERPAHLTAIK
jgi:hypothetical protein